MTVVALGVVPYISASIIMQLLVALWPSLQREVRENAEQGKRKIGKMTRFRLFYPSCNRQCSLNMPSNEYSEAWNHQWRTARYPCLRHSLALLPHHHLHYDDRNNVPDVDR